MREPKLARLELQVLEALWSLGKGSIREIQRELEKTIDRVQRRHGTERKRK